MSGECEAAGSRLTALAHDWRLWERRILRETQTLHTTYTVGPEVPVGPVLGYHETWYCTRCRTIEERTANPPRQGATR